MLRSILIVAVIAVTLYGAGCAVLFAMQRSMIYSPLQKFAGDAGATFAMLVDGVRVVVCTREAPGPNAVIYFGGNGENVSQSIPTLQRAFPESSLYAPHYRGYKGSTGNPSETALIHDALALFDRVYATHPHIVMIGRSLGSGVAIHVASMRPVARLVLVTPYNSLQEIAAKRFPLFPVRWLLLDKFESWRYAPQITAPTLLLAAEIDDVIPPASTQMLYARFRQGVATLTVIPDAGHNTISDTSEYIPLLRGTP